MDEQGSSLDAAPAGQQPTSQGHFDVAATVGRRVGEVGLAGAFGLQGLAWLYPPTQFAAYEWFFVPFFGLVSLHFLVRAFDRRPRLTVDADGITDRTALLLGPLRLKWEEVVDVTTLRLAGGVEIVVRDLDDIGRRSGIARKAWIWLRRLMGKGTISITPTLLGMKKQELERRLSAGLYGFERRQLLQARDEDAMREVGRPQPGPGDG